MTFIKKTLLSTAIAATALASATPAMANDRYERHHDNGAAVAVGAGILGLAIGAIIASGSHDRDRDDRYYYDNGGYPRGYYDGYRNGGWYEGYQYNNGYFYDRRGHRAYDRGQWYRGHANRNDYSRGYDRRDRDGDDYGRRGDNYDRRGDNYDRNDRDQYGRRGY